MKCKHLFLISVLFFLISCGDSAENPGQNSQTNSSTNQDKGSYSLDEEKPCINLIYANGKTDSRCDDEGLEPGHEADITMHRVSKHFEKEQYLTVEIGYYEGGDFELINLRNGNSKMIGGEPTLSPKGTKIAIAQTDLIAGYIFNGFRVYELGEEGPTLIKEITSLDRGARNARWVDDKTVSFDITTMDFETGGAEYILKDTTITF